MTTLRYVFDVETDGFLSEMTRVHCLEVINPDTGEALHFADQPGYLPIEQGLRMLLQADTIIGHNIIKFDIPAIQKVYPWFRPMNRVVDTLVAGRLAWADLSTRDIQLIKAGKLPSNLSGKQSLKAWGYRLGVLKGEYGETADWSQWTEEMQSYCAQDVVVNAALLKRIEQEGVAQAALDLEHEFAAIIAKQERNGFCFDREAAQSLYVFLVEQRLALETQLQEVFPPITHTVTTISKSTNRKTGRVKGKPFTKETVEVFNPGSRQQIASRLKAVGWVPQEFTETGLPKIDEKVLGKLAYPEAKVLARWFMLSKRLGQLAEGEQAWLRVEVNGRIHGSVNTNGAVTGRCTHSNPNVAQVPSVKAEYGMECRALFSARRGWKLVGADLAGVELRCLAHYMARYDGGAYIKVLLEGDIHWVNAIALGLVPEGTVRDDHDPKHVWARGIAKTFIYAFLYGAGDEKIGSIVKPLAPKAIKASLGKRLKASFLKKLPALKRLIDDVKARAKSRGYLVGLDGRRLIVRSAHAALNTLLQSAGALLAKQATIIWFRDMTSRGLEFGKDYALVAHVHDELQIECKETLVEIVGPAATAAMASAGQHFDFRCPIAGDWKSGTTWADTH